MTSTADQRVLPTLRLRRALEKVGEEIGIGLTSHDFRRSLASYLIVAARADEAAVTAFMGHANIETTRRTYAGGWRLSESRRQVLWARRLQDAAPSCGARESTPPFLRGGCTLTIWGHGNWSQPTAAVFACLSRFRPRPICDRLPPFATALLHPSLSASATRRKGRFDAVAAGAAAVASRRLRKRGERGAAARSARAP